MKITFDKIKREFHILNFCTVDTLTRRYLYLLRIWHKGDMYEGWNFNSGNYVFTTDTK